jgi:hypothetical protein
VDPNLQLLKLLTFPIHNVYGISVGVGTAANAGLNAILLPVSIASFVAVNQTDKIPAYVQTVQTNLENAIPGIIKSIQSEVAYDQHLFSTLGTLGTTTFKLPAMKALEAPTVSKIAAGTDADATKALAAGDSTQGSTPAKDSKPIHAKPAKDTEPTDAKPAKHSEPTDATPADSAPTKDSSPAESNPAKGGKPGKTDGVHHQGGATGTKGTANGANAGGASKPSNSTQSKTTGTHQQRPGVGKHRAAAGSGSGSAGSTGHARHAK